MKRYILLIGVAALAAACDVEEIGQPDVQTNYYASFEAAETKVYVDSFLDMHWNSGDRIGLFDASTELNEFIFGGVSGDTEGYFSRHLGNSGGSALDAAYAVYPYSEFLEINSKGEIDLGLPGVQDYAVKGFGRGANTCLAVTSNSSDRNLVFKNLCGYVVVNLYGDGKVEKITLKGNNGEVLAGNARVWSSRQSSPVIMSLDGAEEIILRCGDQGVELGSSADKATAFWFVVPPVTFSKGLTVEVLKTDGETFSKSTTASRTVERNKIFRMEALAVSKTQDDPVPGEVRSLSYTASSKLDAGYDIKFNSDGTVQTVENFLKYEVGQPFCGSVIVEHNFNYTTKHGEIVFSEPITEIEDGAFYGCTLLSGDMVIPDGITKVGAYAFYKCKNLDSWTATDIYQIGKYALAEMTNLKGFQLGNHLEIIPEGLMQNSRVSKNTGGFKLGEHNIIIEDFAFDGCWFTGDLVIPDSVTRIGKAAFRNCKFNGTLSLGANVELIDDLAFRDVPLRNLTLNQKIRRIGTGAFYGCDIYEELLFPESLVGIGDAAFYDCSIHGTLVIPARLTELGTGAFMNTYIENLVIQEGRTEIPEAFACQCYHLESITLPDSIRKIGDMAFMSSDEINCALHLPKSLEYIGNEAFSGCTEMTGDLIFPAGVTYIGESAFDSCYSLDGILQLNEALESIGNRAFYDCYSLKGAIMIPDSVTSLGEKAFYDCQGLTGSLKIGNGITEIPEYAFYNCNGLAGMVSIGNNVRTIGDCAFEYCSSLTHSLIIPDSVVSIGYSAFSGCSSLEKTIRLSKNLTYIGGYAFSRCSSISEVFCPAAVPPSINSSGPPFNNTNLTVIYVPEAVVEEYLNNRTWKSYYSDIIAGYDFNGQ